ncbi:MAG TPA: BTAD domain-containing putative transcriptional regulator [Euzebyales bacterium]|nr:BTAD domain-containing putative transcriptional regulator [Euzebyales bacterium]
MGRQADALAAFQRARQHLVDQLGVEPGPRLRELESLILEHDPQLGSDGSSRGTVSGRPRGTVTFGFCEVVGSSRLWATHRQKTAAAMARLGEIVQVAVDHCGGYVFAAGGESFGVAFHRADDAATWATRLQAAVGSEPWPGGVELRLRVGLHSGETEEQATGYFGPAVNTAARLAAAGHGGQRLLSGVTAVLLGRDDLRDLGTYRLDGVVAEQPIFQLGEGEHPPLRTVDGRRGNLPLRLGRLIGREEDLDVIDEALATSPVVTLVGPGGVGKTRLALAAARMAEGDPREAWLIELAAITSSSDVPRAVAGTLGVTEHPGRTLTQSIVTDLQARQALLVLDNCEHVIDGAAELAQAIAAGCPSVRVLATSREGLGFGDEQLIAVAPLDPAGSGDELFNERARAISRTFDPDAGRPAVEELCRRLDGLPLAIELAAARTRSLTPTDLVERLDDRLRLLGRSRRRSAERHRTLRAVIQWSYDLLTSSERLLFQRLSIFAGPFDLAAAERVAADAALDVDEIDDLLGDLFEQSMLLVESGPFGRRFRLLETMRQFATERLSERGHADLIAARHARWCLEEVTRIHQLLTGPAEIEGVARLGELWADLRTAFEWTCAGRDRKLASALVRPVATEVSLRSRHEIGDWAERLLAVTPRDDEELLLLGLTWAAHRYQQTRDHDAYERLVQRYGMPDHPLIRYARAYVVDADDALVELAPRAVAELRRLGADHLAAHTEIHAAGPLLIAGRFEEVDALVTRLAARYRVQGPPTFLNWSLVTLGYSAFVPGPA